MQLILDKLSKRELDFLLRLLNAAKSYSFGKNFSGFFRRQENLVTGSDATALDREGEVLRRAYERDSVKSWMRPADSLFSKKLTERKIGSVITNWSHARIPIVNAVTAAHESARSFVHAPSIIGVPAHRPPVLLNEPADLVNWLVLRGFANGQLARFVRCDLCMKFGLRKRAKKQARFCSSRCQIEFNVKRKKDADFATIVAG